MERRKKPRFLRKDWHKCIRLGRKKSNRVWRASKGRHGKLRQKWKNHTKMPSIGYGMPKEIRGLVKGMRPVMINNVNDLMNVGKDEIGIMCGKVGLKKRMDIAKKALTMNVKFENFTPQKFLDGMAKMAEEKKKSEKKPEVKKDEAKTEKPKAENAQKKEIKPATGEVDKKPKVSYGDKK